MTAQSDLFELAREIGRALGREVAAEVVAALGGRGSHQGWIDQTQSPLGAKLHCAAVRRRKAEGKGGAEIKGRKHLLTSAALEEEMVHSPKPGLRKASGPAAVARDTIARLRLLRANHRE